MEKSKIIRDLSNPQNRQVIETAFKHIMDNEELSRIESFRDNCEFVLTWLKRISEEENEKRRADYISVYEKYLKEVKIVIQNHGNPKRGHLDDHAERIIGLLDTKYTHLLEKDPRVRESYKIVHDHYHDVTHSMEYEKRLNHLHEELVYAQKEKQTKIERENRKTLTGLVQSN